jgi:hypothetical protein
MTDDQAPAAAHEGNTDSRAADSEATITDVLTRYADGGFTSSFTVTDASQLECCECGNASDPAEVSMSSLRRLEGASDPADMVAIVALTCPVCGAQGTAVLGFGPTATVEDADVLKAMRDNRADTNTPGNSAPGEAHGDDAARD